MKLIYIAGPFRAKSGWEVEHNIREAEELALIVAETGAVPVCPHTMYRFFNGVLPDQFWLDATLDLLRKCDAILLVPRWRESQGAKGERDEAMSLGIPVFNVVMMGYLLQPEAACLRWLGQEPQDG